MRVALAQINPTSADINGNAAKILEAIDAAAAAARRPRRHPRAGAARLLHRRPGRGHGVPRGQRARAPGDRGGGARHHGGRRLHRLRPAARPTITARSASTTPPRSSATAGCCSARASRSCPSYRYFDDKRYFTPGERREPVDDRDGGGPLSRVGVSICEDLWDELLRRQAAARARRRRGRPAAQPERVALLSRASAQTRQRLIRRHIDRLHCPIVYVNTVGAADNGKNIIPFDGESLVYDARRAARRDRPPVRGGPARRRPRSRRAGTTPLELPPDDPRARDVRRAGDVAARLHAEDRLHAAPSCRCRAASTRRWRWRSRSTRSGPDQVTAFNLPSKYNTETTQSIAQRADRGARRALHRDSDPGRSTTRSARCSSSTPIPIAQSLTRENLHARIRGLLMMAESNDTGALLISCGNETEIALGYATLYGDMCGGMSLIGDLSKTDVYRLVALRQPQARPRDHPRGDVHDQAVGRARRRPVRSVRLRGGRADRRRARRAPHQPRRAGAAVRAPRARSGAVQAGRRGAHAVRQVHGRDLPRRSSTTPPGGCAARSTSGCRARRSSSSASAPSASTCARRSSTAGKASGDGNADH